MTNDGGRAEPTKRQARTERENGPKVDGSRPEGGDRRGNRAMSLRWTRLKPVAGISHTLLLSLEHYGGCAGLVGADVVKISGYE